MLAKDSLQLKNLRYSACVFK